MSLGREQLVWNEQLWQRIDEAVHNEAARTEVASKFIPIRGPIPSALTVPADTIDPATMTIDESLTTPLIELWVEFALTQQQVANEEGLSTAVTLGSRAAHMLSQAEDLSIFQGDAASGHKLFKIVKRRGPAGPGLLGAAGVKNLGSSSGAKRSGEQIFEAVVQGISVLQEDGHYGPYALALPTALFAETHAPIAGTLVMAADRIRPLVSAGFHGTGALPDSAGVLVSVGGNTLDLVVGVDPIAAFLQADSQGLYHFRVLERFALRVKDAGAIVRLRFGGK